MSSAGEATLPGSEHPVWAEPVDDVLETLGSNRDGLSQADVEDRLERFGRNQLQASEEVSAWSILVDQFKSVIIALLAAATLVSFLLGELAEAAAVAVVIVLNAAIGFVTEVRAVRSMESLRELGRVETKVRRSGETRLVDAEELVPGDIVVFEGGDVITADLRLLEGHVAVDESTLTGESTPVDKDPAPVEHDAVLAERPPMLHKGTAVTNGSGEGVVVSTGMETELGRITRLVAEADQPETPLQQQLGRLGHKLLWLTLGIALVIVALGVLSGRDLRTTVETAIALAVAAIPEGLPIVATVALARGMKRMSERNVLIEKLAAVETLGSVSVILTDKTGTLTENEMVLQRLVMAGAEYRFGGGFTTEGEVTKDDGDASGDALLEEALRMAVLCTNATLGANPKTDAAGDPSEIALLMGGLKAGIHRQELIEDTPEVDEVPFDPGRRLMATLHRAGDGFFWAVKGGPEAVLHASSRISTPDGEHVLGPAEIEGWLDRNEKLAANGMRVLALARRNVDDRDADPYAEMTFLGLVGLIDPPRSDVGDAIRECHNAGIDVVLVTGDQPATASAIAAELAIDESGPALTGSDLASGDVDEQVLGETHVFARTSPEQKLDLITARQNRGQSVAMIGDGVNDAPALKKADIGVAMGERGTDVAKEAADVVVQDDRFRSIVDAIREGRIIFDNIRKFVMYLLSSNLSEILVVGIGSVLSLPLPILPLQILYLNLVTDVFPALALGVSPGDETIMNRPPRPQDEGVLTPTRWARIAGYGVLITIPVMVVLFVATRSLGLDDSTATTMSFLTLAFAQLWHVFNMSEEDDVIRTEITTNPWIWGAILVSGLLLLALMYIPPLSIVMEVVALEGYQWLMVLGASLVPLVVGQVVRVASRKKV